MNSEAAYFTLRCITCSEPVTSESVILLNKTKAVSIHVVYFKKTDKIIIFTSPILN